MRLEIPLAIIKHHAKRQFMWSTRFDNSCLVKKITANGKERFLTHIVLLGFFRSGILNDILEDCSRYEISCI